MAETPFPSSNQVVGANGTIRATQNQPHRTQVSREPLAVKLSHTPEIWENDFPNTPHDGEHVARVPAEERIRVRAGDVLGLRLRRGPASVGCTRSGPEVLWGAPGTPMAVGETQAFPHSGVRSYAVSCVVEPAEGGADGEGAGPAAGRWRGIASVGDELEEAKNRLNEVLQDKFSRSILTGVRNIVV